MLRSVCGESELAKADIDLVVKTPDNIRPIPEDPQPYEEFCDYFAGTKTLFDLEHHLCHAYQAYLCSPFEDAAILTVDGRGENLARLDGGAISTTLADGQGDRVKVLSEVLAPASVGGMYSTATFHLGFRDEQEGNTMALAAFGTDRFYRVAREDAFDLHDDGSFELSPSTDRGWAQLRRSHDRVLPPSRARGAAHARSLRPRLGHSEVRRGDRPPPGPGGARAYRQATPGDRRWRRLELCRERRRSSARPRFASST